eukprot:GHRR01006589.1.p1 GENE.GHRR01006589.1~~GHRR01006589.1.p1  ORF type:complete len:664 (+),score=211.87 GHRR01006589.1:538-2529(+)
MQQMRGKGGSPGASPRYSSGHSRCAPGTYLIAAAAVISLQATIWSLHSLSSGMSSVSSIMHHVVHGSAVAGHQADRESVPAHWASTAVGSKHNSNKENNAALVALRAQLNSNTTLELVQQQLRGARLPRKTSMAMAQQLMVDVQLLKHSLQEGHAAARGQAMTEWYSSSGGSSSSDVNSDSSGTVTGSGLKQATRQGILITGGGRNTLANAYLLLRMLRQQLRSSAPIELVYYGQEELDPEAFAIIEQFVAAQADAGSAPITIIDGKAVHYQQIKALPPHPDVTLTHWVAKIHALCWVTSFQKVLLLDSDNLPVQDPVVLFDTPAFVDHGFVIWPDFWHNLWMDKAIYNLLDLDIPWEVNPEGLSAESGQVLIDRLRHRDVLEWLWLVNAHADLVYRCVVGDKDTFKMAFNLAGKGHHYMQVQQPPLELLGDQGGYWNRYLHLGMGQLSPDGTALLFIHRTSRGKFFPWCAAKGKLHGHCQPAWITTPVTQEQLFASVHDAGNIRFDSDKIDSRWYLSACSGVAGSSAAAGGSSQHSISGSSTIEERLQMWQLQQLSRTGRRRVLVSSSRAIAAGQQARHVTEQPQQQQLGVEFGPAVQHGAWAMPLPACHYTAGQLPVPVLPPHLFTGLPEYLAALDQAFAEIQPLLPVSFFGKIKVMLGLL